MPRIHPARLLTLGGLLLALPAGGAEGQIPLTPRAVGMGGAYVATARGFESIHFNPAHLGLPDGPAWSVALPQVTVGASVLGADPEDLTDFFDYDDLSDQRRAELLGRIPESGASVDADVRAPVLSIQVGNIGVGIAYGLTGEHTVGKDLVELFFDGYEEGRYDYRVGDTRGDRASYWDLSAGYGRSVGPVSLGIAGHYYHGQSLVRTRAFEPRFDILSRRIEVDYVGVRSGSGHGFGLDVGAAAQPLRGVTLSLSVANLFSTMDWGEDLSGRTLTLTNEDFDDGELMLLEERYEQSERDLGADPTGRFGELAGDLFDDRGFPSTLRMGAAYSPAEGTEIGASYSNRLGAGRLLGPWDQLLGVGAQARIPLVTLRAGASSNLDGGSIVGAGLKLGVVDLAVARFRTAGTPDPAADRDGVVASFSVNVRTRATMR